MNPGDMLAMKVRSRRGAERELKWKIGGREESSYEVKDLDQVTVAQRARRNAWLKGEAQGAGDSNAGAATTGTAGTGAVQK
jgi:hypothetical protein